jgi:hypothetical protein
MKACSRCKMEKDTSCFNKRGGGRTDLHSICKACMREYRKEWIKSPENLARYRDSVARYCASEHGKAKRAAYKQLPRTKAQAREYANSAQGRETAARAKRALLARRPDYNNEYYRERSNRDPWFRLQFALRRRQLHCFAGRRRPGSFVRHIGCTREEFIARMERLFTWDNYGEWQYDHDVPIAAFDLFNREQFMAAVSYQNIVPLWKRDNKSKGAKLFDARG